MACGLHVERVSALLEKIFSKCCISAYILDIQNADFRSTHIEVRSYGRAGARRTSMHLTLQSTRPAAQARLVIARTAWPSAREFSSCHHHHHCPHHTSSALAERPTPSHFLHALHPPPNSPPLDPGRILGRIGRIPCSIRQRRSSSSGSSSSPRLHTRRSSVHGGSIERGGSRRNTCSTTL